MNTIRLLSVTRSLAPNIPPDLMPILTINLPELICTVWLGIWSSISTIVNYWLHCADSYWQRLDVIPRPSSLPFYCSPKMLRIFSTAIRSDCLEGGQANQDSLSLFLT